MNQHTKVGEASATRSEVAFTLIELLTVIVIVASLLGIAIPATRSAIEKGHQAACSSNLRQLASLVELAALENDGRIPYIETDPSDPVYPAEYEAKGLLETLKPYGATESIVRCASDVAGPNYFKARGTSYEWRPLIDGEPLSNPVIYGFHGEFVISLSRYRLMFDVEAVHNGRRNNVYADGRVNLR